jgi:hypothetical protein
MFYLVGNSKIALLAAGITIKRKGVMEDPLNNIKLLTEINNPLVRFRPQRYNLLSRRRQKYSH